MLLDSSVLIAATDAADVHFTLIDRWLAGRAFATCPITQGAMLRHQCRVLGPAAMFESLRLLSLNPHHTFWPDAVPYDESALVGVTGYRQITDAYLVSLAAHHDAQLATLDVGLARAHQRAVLITNPESLGRPV